MKKLIKAIVLWSLLLLPYAGLYFVYQWYHEQLSQVKNAKLVLISKQDMRLRVIDFKANELMNIPVATGLYPGNKLEKGDMRTPEGTFTISSIENASEWKHDFKDGNGEITGAYGSHFIRLNTPGHSGIGIHGTHFPGSIGSKTTEGCIRISNENLRQFVPMIHSGMIVIITPGKEDVNSDTLQNTDK